MLKIRTLGLWACLFLALPAMAAETKPPETVFKAMQADKDLSSFVALVKEAGMEKALNDPAQPVTVFAPNNAAVGAIPSAIQKQIKADKVALSRLVQLHMITGSKLPLGIIAGRRAGPSSALGEPLTFDGAMEKPKVNGATIVKNDEIAGNGYVHVIDKTLIPVSLAPPTASAPSAAAAPAAATTPAAAPAPSVGVVNKLKALFGFGQ